MTELIKEAKRKKLKIGVYPIEFSRFPGSRYPLNYPLSYYQQQ